MTEPTEMIDLRQTLQPPTNLRKLAGTYRELRLNRQSAATHGAPPELLQSLTVQMIEAADALCVAAFKA